MRFDEIFGDDFVEILWSMPSVSLFCCDRGFSSLRPFS